MCIIIYSIFLDREKVRLWLSRLHHIREDISLRDLEIYEEYMWFLRTVMEMGCLYTPFNKNPPPTTCDLAPLQIVVVKIILITTNYYLK